MWKWTRCSNPSKRENQEFYKALRNNFILIRRLKITIFLSRNFNGASLPPLQIHKWHMFKNRLKYNKPGSSDTIKATFKTTGRMDLYKHTENCHTLLSTGKWIFDMFIKIKVRGGGGYSLWEDFTGLNSRKDVKLKTRLSQTYILFSRTFMQWNCGYTRETR